MKKNIILIVFLLVSVFAGAQSIKIGHINSVQLLQLMPQVKVADSALQVFQKNLEQLNTSMLQEYQTEIVSYQRDSATMTPVTRTLKKQEISDLGSRIQAFQQSAPDSLQSKKQQLYAPILKKANDAVQAVAKANGYSYVFDTSSGAVVYAPPTDDLIDLVKKQLGLTK
jgi:outer membrane protein